MDKPQVVAVDWHDDQNWFEINAKLFFEKRYVTELDGRGLIHAGYSTHEYAEHCYLQHSILVYLGSEDNSLRKIGDTLHKENINYGDIAIVPAGVNHWKQSGSDVSEMIVLTIEPNFLSRIARENINTNSIELKPTFAQTDTLIQSIALNIKAELDRLKSDRVYVESLFQALLLHLLKNHCHKEYYPQQAQNGLPPYKLRQAINYINHNLAENIKTCDLAQMLGLSQYYFCRLFRESLGIPPYRYVIQRRISKAKVLIRENQLPLSDISIECGFSSQSQMTHHFRKLVGVTPKVYRDRL